MKKYEIYDECNTLSKTCTYTNAPCGLKKAACANYETPQSCEGNLILGDKTQCTWDSGTSACKNAA